MSTTNDAPLLPCLKEFKWPGHTELNTTAQELEAKALAALRARPAKWEPRNYLYFTGNKCSRGESAR